MKIGTGSYFMSVQIAEKLRAGREELESRDYGVLIAIIRFLGRSG